MKLNISFERDAAASSVPRPAVALQKSKSLQVPGFLASRASATRRDTTVVRADAMRQRAVSGGCGGGAAHLNRYGSNPT